MVQPVEEIKLIGMKEEFASGGIGVSKEDWENDHGGSQSSDGLFNSYSDNLTVRFSCSGNDCNGNVKYIEKAYGDKNKIPIDDARTASTTYFPADAKYVNTYTNAGGSTVDLYNSESLKSRFPASEFIGGQPGDFTAIYRNQTGAVTTFIIAIGNNP